MSESRLAEYLDQAQRAAADACDFVGDLTKVEFLDRHKDNQCTVREHPTEFPGESRSRWPDVLIQGSSTMLNADAETFIWRLLQRGLLSGDPKQAGDWVASFYDRRIELPAKLEALVTEYWASADRAVLFALAQAVLADFSLDVVHRTRLTAYLFAKGLMDETKACAWLGFEAVITDDLPPSVRRVADVCWLIRQDSQAAVMESGDYSLLSESLRALASEGTATTDY
jgi:hypothetical protein